VTALAIAKASLLRVARDRTALFFIIALPILVIIIIGATVRGLSSFRVGVVDLGSGPSGQDIVAGMQHSGDLKIHPYPSISSVTKAVARGEVSVGVVLPAGMDTSLRAGQPVDIEVLAEQSNSSQQAAFNAVNSIVASEGSKVQAALFASSLEQAGGYDQNLARAASMQSRVPLVDVHAIRVDSRSSTLPEGFSYSAPTMLVLFVFINTLAGAANIIETRRLGIYERMSAAPIRARTIIAGETISLVSVSLLQAALIVLVGAVAFGVSWGNPVAAMLLIAVWATVAAAAGMLAGTLFCTPEQASALGPTLGIALGMLGGCMWPLSIVSSTMRTIGHATPHAWAVDAWTALIARGSALPAIGRDLAALAAFAAILMALAAVRLRRVLT
jgi:ABC-2 type transport system permease protein